MSIVWNTGAAATRFRLKNKKKKKASSSKLQAPSSRIPKGSGIFFNKKRFDLTFDAEDEQDAEEQAMMEVKQYLGDYITAYADEEENE